MLDPLSSISSSPRSSVFSLQDRLVGECLSWLRLSQSVCVCMCNHQTTETDTEQTDSRQTENVARQTKTITRQTKKVTRQTKTDRRNSLIFRQDKPGTSQAPFVRGDVCPPQISCQLCRFFHTFLCESPIISGFFGGRIQPNFSYMFVRIPYYQLGSAIPPRGWAMGQLVWGICGRGQCKNHGRTENSLPHLSHLRSKNFVTSTRIVQI